MLELANLHKVKVPKIKDPQVLLSLNDNSNSGETFWCTQSTNQVSNCSCDAWEMVELHKSDCLVDLVLLMNHCCGC